MFSTRKAIAVVLAFVMFTGLVRLTVPPTAYAATKSTATKSPTFVSLGKSATVSIKNVELFTQEKGLFLIYTLTYSNNGNSTLALDDYWAKVNATKGKSFSTRVVDKDKKITSLPAKSSANITYFSALDDGITLSQLRLNIIKWNFSAANYMTSIGNFDLSKGYGVPVAALKPSLISSKETKLNTQIKAVQTALDGDDRIVNITYQFDNLNTREYKAANTLFYIVTSDGSVYAAENSGLKDLIVKPKQKKVISLKATIPNSITTKNIKLVYGYQSEADGIFVPLAAYQLPVVKDNTSAGVSQLNYNNLDISLTGFNRLPAAVQDTLTGQITISNRTTNELKIPSLKASWVINGVSQDSKTPILTAFDSRLQLAPGESVQLAAVTTVPYTVNLKDVQLVLKESVDAQNESLIGQLKSPNINQYLAAAGQKVTFDRLASKSLVELLRVRTTDEGKLIGISGDLAVSNLEGRPKDLQKYGVYLKGADGQIYPLVIADYDKAVIANGKILVPFVGKVPATAKAATMSILFTELLPYTGDIANKETAVATNLMNLSISWPEAKVNPQFNNLAIGKFNFSFDKVYTSLDMASDFMSAQGLKLQFDYTNTADNEIDDLAGVYKLRFEIEDQGLSKATYTKDFILSGKDKTDDFPEGKFVSKTILFNDTNILQKIGVLTSYKLSVFCVVNDEKVLLAQKVIPYNHIESIQP